MNLSEKIVSFHQNPQFYEKCLSYLELVREDQLNLTSKLNLIICTFFKIAHLKKLSDISSKKKTDIESLTKKLSTSIKLFGSNLMNNIDEGHSELNDASLKLTNIETKFFLFLTYYHSTFLEMEHFRTFAIYFTWPDDREGNFFNTNQIRPVVSNFVKLRNSFLSETPVDYESQLIYIHLNFHLFVNVSKKEQIQEAELALKKITRLIDALSQNKGHDDFSFLFVVALHLRALVYVHLDRMEESKMDLSKILEIRNKYYYIDINWVILRKGMCNFYLKKFNEALKDINQATEGKEKGVDFFINRSRVFHAMLNFEDAIDDIESAMLIAKPWDNKTKDFLYLQKAIYLNHYENGAQKALNVLEKVKDQSSKEFSQTQARIFRKLNEHEKVKNILTEQINSSEKKNPNDFLERSLALRKLKKYKEAMEDIDKGIEIFLQQEKETGKIDDDVFFFYYEKAILFYKYKDFSKAEEWFEKMIDDNYPNADALVNRGFYRIKMKHYEKAIEDFTLSHKIKASGNPLMNRSIANEAIGKKKECQNDLKEAVELYKLQIEQKKKKNISSYQGELYDICFCYDRLKKTHKSIELLENALKNSPKIFEESAVFYNDLGFYLERDGRYSEAVVALKKSIAIDKKYRRIARKVRAFSYAHLGYAYIRLGENYHEIAKKNLENALRLSPNYYRPFEYFGIYYFDYKKDYKKALELFLKAIELKDTRRADLIDYVKQCKEKTQME